MYRPRSIEGTSGGPGGAPADWAPSARQDVDQSEDDENGLNTASMQQTARTLPCIAVPDWLIRKQFSCRRLRNT
jgi:hypothetical protein